MDRSEVNTAYGVIFLFSKFSQALRSLLSIFTDRNQVTAANSVYLYVWHFQKEMRALVAFESKIRELLYVTSSVRPNFKNIHSIFLCIIIIIMWQTDLRTPITLPQTREHPVR